MFRVRGLWVERGAALETLEVLVALGTVGRRSHLAGLAPLRGVVDQVPDWRHLESQPLALTVDATAAMG